MVESEGFATGEVGAVMGKHEKKDPQTGEEHEPDQPVAPDSDRPGKHRKIDPSDEARRPR
jgi:hypothetical protein